MLPGKEQARNGRRSTDDRGNDSGNTRNLRADREPVARPAYRWGNDVTQRQAPGAPMQRKQAGELTGTAAAAFPT